jgi:hypothetical protein
MGDDFARRLLSSSMLEYYSVAAIARNSGHGRTFRREAARSDDR